MIDAIRHRILDREANLFRRKVLRLREKQCANERRLKALLARDVGRTVQFRRPTEQSAFDNWLDTNGTTALGTFQITGIQYNYRGEVCYTVKCLDYEDRCGRVMGLNDAVFV
jgi:hypothetical protein